MSAMVDIGHVVLWGTFDWGTLDMPYNDILALSAAVFSTHLVMQLGDLWSSHKKQDCLLSNRVELKFLHKFKSPQIHPTAA